MSKEDLSKKRAAAKGKLTRAINRLTPSLKKLGADAQMCEVEVHEGIKTFVELYNNFKAAHEAVYRFVENEKDEKIREENLAKEEEYFHEVRSNCCAIEKGYSQFKNLLQSYPEQVHQYESVLANYNISLETAQKMVGDRDTKSFEELMADPEVQGLNTQDAATDLTIKLEKLVNGYRAIKTFLVLNGKSDQEIQEITKYDHNTLQVSHSTTFRGLFRISEVRKKLNVQSTVVSRNAPAGLVNEEAPIKLEKAKPITWNGKERDFATFKREFEAIVVPRRHPSQVAVYLKEAIPEKHKHLLNNHNLDDYQGMMKTLSEKFGTSRQVIMSIVAELGKLSIATSDRQFVTFVETIEKAERDLEAVDSVDQLENETILTMIESKLPERIKSFWLKNVVDKNLMNETARNKYKELMRFLSNSRTESEYQISESNFASNSTKFCAITGRTFHTKSTLKETKSCWAQNKSRTNNNFKFKPCLACAADGATNLEVACHDMAACDNWNGLLLKDRIKMVNCHKHPFAKDGHKYEDCKKKIVDCKHCGHSSHHHLFCVVGKSSSTRLATSTFKSADTNVPEVLLKTLIVQGEKPGQKLGVMEDNCSTDNYVTHSKAKELKLKGKNVVLRIEGINSVKEIKTKIYKVQIRDKKQKLHVLECYGLKNIASDAILPDVESYKLLCKNFNVSTSQVKRPTTIDLLLSSKSNYLMSDKVYKSYNGIKLYGGPLGKTFGGFNSDLTFNSHVKSYPSKVFPVLQSCVKRASCDRDPNARRVSDVYPDENNIVNVAPSSLHNATKPNRKGVAMIKLKKHVNNLVVNVPHGEDDVEAGHGGECKNE